MIKKRQVALVMLLSLAGCGLQPYDTERYVDNAKQAPGFEQVIHKFEGRTIGGAVAGSACQPAVLLIHGAPGTWQSWARYFTDGELTKNAFLMAYDRPGYGASDKGQFEPSLQKQANLILQAAEKSHAGPFIVVGHSFGGPVAVQMALDAPEAVASMILLAASVDPAMEKVTWYQAMADWKVFNWLVPGPLNVANKEIFPLKKELETQQENLGRLATPTVVIQGDKDTLVPKQNADFLQQRLTNAPMEMQRLPEQGHFLPWLEYDLVKAQILKAATQQRGCSN